MSKEVLPTEHMWTACFVYSQQPAATGSDNGPCIGRHESLRNDGLIIW